MAQRRFGPTRGAGTAIIEKEGDKPIEKGALGWVGYAGILEKGQVGELIQCSNKTQFEKQCGSYIADSLLPDCCYDFFKTAAGAGGLYLVRVTDGNEVQAEITLYARKTSMAAMGKIKAKNGGRWAGKAKRYWNEVASSGDIAETALTTGITSWTKDEWKGGWLELEEVASTRYPIIGNTAAGVVTVAADQTMSTDFGAGTDLQYYLYLENESKEVTCEIRDGIENPTTEFGLYIYVDGDLELEYTDLSTDPTSNRYWVNIINNDDSNHQIVVEDLWTGAHVADVRPANLYGLNSAIAATSITAVIHEFDPATTGDADGTAALGTTTDDHVAQVLTLTFSDATTAAVVSDKFGALGDLTVGSEFSQTDHKNKWVPPFTLTAGASVWEAADVATLIYKPFVADELIGGSLYPDKPNATREFYRITDNDHDSITVAAGSDMTNAGARTGGETFLVVAPLPMGGGKDGIADLADSDYEQQAWDTSGSPFNQIQGKNAGLIKFATPGNFATAVQKAGLAYAAAKNHQYRYEVDSSLTTEAGVDAYINDTIGRSDYAKVSFPSYGYVADPEGNGEGRLKLVPLTGKIHGREARIAVDYDGYHKAGAGLDATLPGVLKLTTGDAILDEEYLNPLGINIVKKMSGNFVLWGDRTLWTDPNWKWAHQREQMSYYEQVLEESFDWIIFMINDKETQDLARASLKSFFLPEWVKRALRGDTFEDAAQIKIDDENNTNATIAAGDLNAEVTLRLADTVERFIITIGKMGIFDSVA